MRTTLLLSLSILFALPGFTQEKPDLKKRIDKLTTSVLAKIDQQELFLKSGKELMTANDIQVIKELIRYNGFPTISMVGAEASKNFGTLIIYSDTEVQMQIAVLKHMSHLVRNGDVSVENYAILTDRVRLNRELPQLYGSQYVTTDMDYVRPYPIYDAENIDIRRKFLGLPKYSVYENKMQPLVVNLNEASSETSWDDTTN